MGQVFKTTKYSNYLGEYRPLLDIVVENIQDTPTPTPSVTPTITPTTSVTPTNTPTQSVTPTNTVTPTHTMTPTPSPVIVIPPTSITVTGAGTNFSGSYTFKNVPARMVGFPQVFQCDDQDSLWSKNVGGVRQNIHLASQGGASAYLFKTSTNSFSCGGSAGSTTTAGNIPTKVIGTDGYFYPKEGTYEQPNGSFITITYVY